MRLYDVVMKTAEVESSCHMNIDLQAGFMSQKLEMRCEKKTTLFCLKFCLKNLYFTKNSLLKKTLFLEEPARGPARLLVSILLSHPVHLKASELICFAEKNYKCKNVLKPFSKNDSIFAHNSVENIASYSLTT